MGPSAVDTHTGSTAADPSRATLESGVEALKADAGLTERYLHVEFQH